jgi:Cys-rich protein (TIGR01571 family)
MSANHEYAQLQPEGGQQPPPQNPYAASQQSAAGGTYAAPPPHPQPQVAQGGGYQSQPGPYSSPYAGAPLQGQQPIYGGQQPSQFQQPMYGGQQPAQFQQPVYAGQQPVYAYAVAPRPGGYVQNMGQPGHLPMGKWSDGVFDCFDSAVICLLSCCLVPIRWAQTAERLQFNTFINALLVYGIPWLICYICQVVYDVTHVAYMWIPLSIFWCVQIYLGMTYRQRMRERYQIPGSSWEDFCLHAFCRCCAVAQEARHVDRDLAFPI